LTPRFVPKLDASFGLIKASEATTPPQSSQPDQPFSCTKLAVHHCFFEAVVGVLSGRTKGQNLALQETKCPSSTTYKWM